MAISAEINETQGSSRASSHRGVAFLIEALVVLGFLMLALAVFVQLFSSAQLEALKARRLSEAVEVATNCAEEFSADPTGVEQSFEAGDFTVTCDVAPDVHAVGTLYKATVTVSDSTGEIYTLATSRYVSGARVRGGGA